MIDVKALKHSKTSLLSFETSFKIKKYIALNYSFSYQIPTIFQNEVSFYSV